MILCYCDQPLDERRTEIPEHGRLDGKGPCEHAGESTAPLFAKRLDAYEAEVRARTPAGGLILLDTVEECPIPSAILKEIDYVRSGAPEREAANHRVELLATADKRENLAKLCDQKAAEAEKEIADWIVSMQKADAAKLPKESARCEKEITRAKKAVATNKKNAENLRAESAHLREQAAQIDAAGREQL